MYPFNILFITHTTTLYGANRSLLNLIDGLKSKDPSLNAVVLIPEKGDIEKELKKRNLAYHIIPFYWEMSSLTHSTYKGYLKNVIKWGISFLLLLRYYKRFKNLRPDIIHSNSSVINFGAYLASFFSIPHVWHIREFGREDYNLKHNFGQRYFKFWLRRAEAIIAISKSIYDYYDLSALPTSHIIYNGIISLKKIQTEKIDHNRAKDGAFTFIIAGIISPKKNQLEGLMAFHQLTVKHRCLRLRIIGAVADEKYGEELIRYIQDNDLNDIVKLEGFVDNTAEIYRNADCLLMCSKHEAMGRVTVESMAFGIPVIGYRAGGTVELIEDHINGLLYNSLEELEQKMELLVMDRNMAAKLAQNAMKKVEEKYTVEIYADKCYQLYRALMENNTDL